MRTAILFDHFGPYHLARLRAAGANAFGVEFFGRSGDYAWDRADFAEVQVITLLMDPARHLEKRLLRDGIRQTLSDSQPDVVAIPGWSSGGALTALEWCLENHKPCILMSESTAHDENRRFGKEFVKRRLVALFVSAFAGGRAHAMYLQKLGVPREKIFLGYDTVDNDHFKKAEAEECLFTSSEPFFLASARFIEKKNLPRLLTAYAAYRERILQLPYQPNAWSLILLGDGALRAELERFVVELNLQDCVQMPGFKQYHELPAYYARASAFIHASTTEQWGLVVNEAMASGLPVLVSNRCGCAPDLVQEGTNGFSFDPYDGEAMTEKMLQMSVMPPEELKRLGHASEEIISHWGPQRFGEGLSSAAKLAVESPVRRFGWLDRLLLKLLCLR